VPPRRYTSALSTLPETNDAENDRRTTPPTRYEARHRKRAAAGYTTNEVWKGGPDPPIRWTRYRHIGRAKKKPPFSPRRKYNAGTLPCRMQSDRKGTSKADKRSPRRPRLQSASSHRIGSQENLSARTRTKHPSATRPQTRRDEADSGKAGMSPLTVESRMRASPPAATIRLADPSRSWRSDCPSNAPRYSIF
jgi:hypothetical protein